MKMKVIIVCCHDNYDVRVKYIEKFFLKKNYSVNILTSNFDHIKKQKRKPYNDNFIMINVPEYKKNISVQRIISEVFFSRKAKEIIKRIKPDIIYVIAPPNSLIKNLSEIKNEKNFLLIDLLDVWPETFPNRWIAQNKIWANLRNNYLKYADKVFLECNFFKTFVEKYVDLSRIDVVYLTKEIGKCNINFNEKFVQILYIGSLNRIFDDINTINLLYKINQIKKVIFHLIGSGEKKDEFLTNLMEKKIEFIDYGMVFDDDEKEKIISRCNYGLNMYKDGVKIGLTMKSVDYFRFGIPVISRNIVDTEEILEKFQAGFVVKNNLDEVAFAIANQTEIGWEKMHKNSYEVMNKYFTPEILFSHLENIGLQP